MIFFIGSNIQYIRQHIIHTSATSHFLFTNNKTIIGCIIFCFISALQIYIICHRSVCTMIFQTPQTKLTTILKIITNFYTFTTEIFVKPTIFHITGFYKKAPSLINQRIHCFKLTKQCKTHIPSYLIRPLDVKSICAICFIYILSMLIKQTRIIINIGEIYIIL